MNYRDHRPEPYGEPLWQRAIVMANVSIFIGLLIAFMGVMA